MEWQHSLLLHVCAFTHVHIMSKCLKGGLLAEPNAPLDVELQFF